MKEQHLSQSIWYAARTPPEGPAMSEALAVFQQSGQTAMRQMIRRAARAWRGVGPAGAVPPLPSRSTAPDGPLRARLAVQPGRGGAGGRIPGAGRHNAVMSR